MSRLSRKLEALEYPYGWDDENVTVGNIREMVVWLEDTKIRWLPVADRAKLKVDDEKAFMDGLLGYCQEVGYGKGLEFAVGMDVGKEKGVRQCLDWIVGKAVRFAFGDSHEGFNEGHEKYRSMGMSNVTKIQSDETDLDDTVHKYDTTDEEGMLAITSRILSLLSLPPDSDLESALFTISRAIHDIKFYPAHKRPIAPPTVEELLSHIPPEHSKDPSVEKALKILRTLFVSDLRELQNRISEIVCELQGVTHNIKTDVSAGVVGS
eukprot:TRINITY_DN6369_c0_g1_i1.p1 TRINITY_DN6369_c0_g1~~TRINITY_DN6369_c0_g1_i1.p1  ORF type:complete len:265 (+),score=68.96 TRINITY_DN6369_c0_g1_i1:394-1188(+)